MQRIGACRIMKTLIAIWVLVLITIVGGSWYMLNTINKMVIEEQTSVLTPRSTLTVQSSDSTQLQPVQALYEDEMRPSDVIQPTMLSNELQHQKHSWFIQGTEWGFEVTYDPSLAEDVTLSNGVTPLVIYGTLDTQGLIRL